MYQKIKPISKNDLENIKARLGYNSESGNLFWQKGSRRIKVGSVAGGLTAKGYVKISIDYKEYRAHYICWYLHYGEWPDFNIDHVNGDKADNAINNLRKATSSENNLNRSIHRSGRNPGVHQRKNGMWIATAPKNYLNRHSDKQQYLGYYKTEQDAELAVYEFCMTGKN